MTTLPVASPALPARLTAPDRRSDDLRRHVTLSHDTVTIARQYRGIAMQVAVPIKAYRGVCVGVKPDTAGGLAYELRLEHRDQDLSVSLAEAPDDRDIWADWRSWAAALDLPALVERSDGLAEWSPARCSARAAQPCPAGGRRRRRRRAAFITRRQARAGAPAILYGKTELIAPE